MSESLVLADAVTRHGWRRVETAARVWAGGLRLDESECPRRVLAWRRALAEVVDVAISRHGVDGLAELAGRVVRKVDAPRGEDNLDDAVARWAHMVAVLDSATGAGSSFPLAVLGPRDVVDIVRVADELDGAGSVRAAA
ncbi:hypothetical protein LG299_02735 [Microbacterium lacus]|uniref:hypothetical protein n=1 Tax=Microbacterium lacus TaxID=415217 RepID=UPI00384C6108